MSSDGTRSSDDSRGRASMSNSDSDGARTITGSCHCGAITLEMRVSCDPSMLAVRECQCTFCRRQGARNVTDNRGHVSIRARDVDLNRYRFGMRTADFLMCRVCGIYVGAFTHDAASGRSFATINTRVLTHPFDQASSPVDYDAEPEAQRLARRADKWTPAELIVA